MLNIRGFFVSLQTVRDVNGLDVKFPFPETKAVHSIYKPQFVSSMM